MFTYVAIYHVFNMKYFLKTVFTSSYVDNLLTRYANNKIPVFYQKSLEDEKKVVSLHFELSTSRWRNNSIIIRITTC